MQIRNLATDHDFRILFNVMLQDSLDTEASKPFQRYIKGKWHAHINKICKQSKPTTQVPLEELEIQPPKLKTPLHVNQLFDVTWNIAHLYGIHIILMTEQGQKKMASFVQCDYSWQSSVSAMVADLGWDSLQ